MLKIEHTEVLGWEHAIRGMRNPMNSWEKSDSWYTTDDGTPDHPNVHIGLNDLDLMKRLRNAGTDHRKFMRMIAVYVDITAPLYWWKEFDTYKVGTVANSCSTMHKITAKEFALEDFSHEHLIVAGLNSLKRTIDDLNSAREGYLDERIKQNPEWRKEVWWQMIQLLPPPTINGGRSCSTMKFWPTSTRAGGTTNSTNGIPSAIGLKSCRIAS